MTFPQLRIQTEHTLRETFAPINRVVERLKAIGAPLAAAVDINGCHGHVKWDKACREAGIQPAFGYVDRFPVEIGEYEFKPHRWCLATDTRKFYNFASSETPDWTQGEGIIRFAGTAPLQAECCDYIDLNPSSSYHVATRLEQHRATGIPLVLTGLNFYPAPEDRDLLLAISGNGRIAPQHILKPSEFREAFWMLDDCTFGKAWDNTLEVGERLMGIELAKAPMIHFDGDLRALCEEGKKYRLERGHIAEWTSVYEERLNQELEIIFDKEFDSYFLVVADLISWAKSQMLVGHARGSSCGSLVCYLTRITEIDPLPYNLLFERFVSPERADLPDIDLDLNDQKRMMALEYLQTKYGIDNVCQLANSNTLKSRSAMAEVGKRLGVDMSDTFDVKNVLIEYSSGDARYGKGLEDTLENTAPGRKFVEKYPEASKLMGEVEMHAWNIGKHAGAMVVCNEPVIDFCCVSDGVAHLDKYDAEHLNLLKIDALGLRTLGVIEDAGVMTAQELYDLKFDDPKVYDTINSGRYAGLFQFEGAAARRVASGIPVDSFDMIAAVNALARPGPLGGGAASQFTNVANGNAKVSLIHESMEPYLGYTFGVPLYQEQAMRTVKEIGGFDWTETSYIRKAMSGRKGEEFFNRKRPDFVEGAARFGIDQETAEAIFNQIASFGCLSGDSIITICGANQHSPRELTIRQLVENQGFAKLAEDKGNREYQLKNKPKAKVWGLGRSEKINYENLVGNRITKVWESGKKETFLLRAENLSIRLTKCHKVFTDRGWVAAGRLTSGDKIASMGESSYNRSRARQHKANPDAGPRFGCGANWSERRGKGSAAFKSNRQKLIDRDPHCAKCGNPWEACHHIDEDRKNNELSNLELLCSKCHRLEHGGQTPNSNGRDIVWVEFESLSEPRVEMTYDLTTESSSFVANGILVHNSWAFNASHAYAYAAITYITAYLKTYYPLEFAAALLRNAKDEAQVMETLRELDQEGIQYIAFDWELSDETWTVKDGKLVGGFENIKGVGPAKSAGFVERRNAGTLTDKDREFIAKRELMYSNLTPVKDKYGEMYRNPGKYNIAGRIKEFGDLSDGENACVICRITRKDRRDENEQVRIKRRGGKRWDKGEPLFLDMFVLDDSISREALVRLRPDMWEDYGIKIADRAVDGKDYFLVRGRYLADFGMIICKKIKCLTNPSIFE